MNKKKTLWLCLVLAAGCALLFGGCDELASLLGEVEGAEEEKEKESESEPENNSGGPSGPAFYVHGLNGADDGDGYDGKSKETAFKTLGKAYAAAVADNAIKQIVVLSDLAVVDNASIELSGDCGEITIAGAGNNLKYKITRNTGDLSKPSVLEIKGGAKISLVNIAVEGKAASGAYFNRAILVTGSGTEVTLGKDAVVTGKIDGSSYSTDKFGGGILVASGGKLVMNEDSMVTDCAGASEGGAVAVKDSGSVFEMKKGSLIYNNTSAFHGGGVAVSSNGKFTMNGGGIDLNKTGAIGLGGGLRLTDNGKAEIYSDSVISNNTAKYGGGIYIVGGSILEMTGGTISSNKAQKSGDGGDGGGVHVAVDNGFRMSGGEISGNTAENYGGGLLVSDYNVKITMSGGTISKNKALVNGGGVALRSGNYYQKFEIKDTAIVYGGTDSLANTAILGFAIFRSTGLVSINGSDSEDQQWNGTVKVK
jgi:hypothetical protein